MKNPIQRAMSLENLTQAEFARRYGMSQPDVHRFVKGKGLPSLKTAFRLEEVTSGLVPVRAWKEVIDERNDGRRKGRRTGLRSKAAGRAKVSRAAKRVAASR